MGEPAHRQPWLGVKAELGGVPVGRLGVGQPTAEAQQVTTLDQRRRRRAGLPEPGLGAVLGLAELDQGVVEGSVQAEDLGAVQ